MTPSGVEQLAYLAVSLALVGVTPTMTPQGVEQVILGHSSVTVTGEPDDDAARR